MREAKASLYAVDFSGHQLQGRVERSLLDDRSLPEPRGVNAVLIASCPALVIDILGDGVEQSPSGAFSGF